MKELYPDDPHMRWLGTALFTIFWGSLASIFIITAVVIIMEVLDSLRGAGVL